MIATIKRCADPGRPGGWSVAFEDGTTRRVTRGELLALLDPGGTRMRPAIKREAAALHEVAVAARDAGRPHDAAVVGEIAARLAALAKEA